MGNMLPSDFLWGAATAGYQVEGNISNNDWDFFTSDPVIHARVAALGKLASPPEYFRLRPAGPAVHHANLRVCPTFYTRGGPVICGPCSINSAMSRERYCSA